MAAKLGFSQSHKNLGMHYFRMKNSKKAKFHFGAATMAGHEGARCNLGTMEAQSGNMGRAVKHWNIAASAGSYLAMHHFRTFFENGIVIERESLDSTLTAYKSSCGEMISEARDAHICSFLDVDLGDFN
jgi:TPR repeat protein